MSAAHKINGASYYLQMLDVRKVRRRIFKQQPACFFCVRSVFALFITAICTCFQMRGKVCCRIFKQQPACFFCVRSVFALFITAICTCFQTCGESTASHFLTAVCLLFSRVCVCMPFIMVSGVRNVLRQQTFLS